MFISENAEPEIIVDKILLLACDKFHWFLWRHGFRKLNASLVPDY